ncbi:MAG: argininosuccinate lyase [Vicinamibacterales bacterium]
MRFAKPYVNLVLDDNFEDAKALLLSPLMAIHRAHLVMLTERSIVSRDHARRLRDALERISEEDIRRVTFDGTFEDLFFYIERLIEQDCGSEIAGRLHTARSRNDIAMTMYRMRQREWILDVVHGVLALRDTLLEIAGRHRDTIFPAHTHTQPAQPSTVGHYLMAAVEQLERDADRLRSGYVRTNCNPLGACAITGTGFPIDRNRTSQLLGFARPTGNTYGSIATADYLLESLSATEVLLVGLGRLLQDLLLWCTAEVQYLRLTDGFVQGSSIMPQKRNPVGLEHARAITSRALGEAGGVRVVLHNTPFGDIVDTEDDLQPLVHNAFRDASRAVHLVAAALDGADFNRELMEARARGNWITITELADTLTREHGMAFVHSHAIAARLIAAREQMPEAPLTRLLAEAAAEVVGVPVHYEEPALARILSPRHFIDVRTTTGGPAPAELQRAIDASRSMLASDRQWLDGATTDLQSATTLLTRDLRAL